MTVSRHEETALRAVLEGTAAAIGVEFHRGLVRHLAQAMGVRTALISRRLNDPGTRLRTLAVWHDDRLIDNFDYDAAGAPCESVIRNRSTRIHDGLRRSFPGNPWLEAWEAESYVGIPVLGESGRVLGHLAVFDRAPLQPEVLQDWILEIFACRIGGELERGGRQEVRDRDDPRYVSLLERCQRLDALGALTGGVAHELNNLLTTLLANANLALESIPRNSPAHRRIERIKKSSLRAADLTREMLAFSANDEAPSVALDLNRLVGEMAPTLRTLIPAEAQLDLDFTNGCPPIAADGILLRQTVIGLVSNASEALREGRGLIRIKTCRVAHGSIDSDTLDFDHGAASRDCACLCISDNGAGMDETTRKRAFERAFSTKLMGRGLGLSAVLEIVRRHEGAIGIDSRPGIGTTVRVLFPAVGPSVDDHAVPEAAAGAARQTVLVVDDDEGVRTVTRSMLEAFGFRVLAASDGAEGVELFRRHRGQIRAVLLDLSMPRPGGGGLLDALRLVDPDAPVIVMSGYDEQGAKERLHGNGQVAFLQKPFGSDELIDKVQRLLDA